MLNDPMVLTFVCWWGPAFAILVGLFILAKKSLPLIIQSYVDRIEEQTKVLQELQKTMATGAQRGAIEHREQLILLKNIARELERSKDEREGRRTIGA